jgi:hypothetical protein
MVEAGKNNFNKLNCKQINLQHSKSATLHLCNLLVELKIYIALIQEPYAKRNILDDETRFLRCLMCTQFIIALMRTMRMVLPY